MQGFLRVSRAVVPVGVLSLMGLLTSLLLPVVEVCSSTSSDDLTVREIVTAFCPRVTAGPRIDGILDDAVWWTASVLSPFHLTTTSEPKPAKQRTRAFVAFDDEWLYIAVECEEPEPEKLRRRYQIWEAWDRDEIFYDDRVEIFLDPDHDHRSYFHFVVNVNGVQFDQRCFRRLPGSRTCDMDPSWNGCWRARTRVGEDRWTVEIAIAYSSLGVDPPKEGTTWGFNVARVRQPEEKNPGYFERTPPKPKYPTEYSAWVYVHDSIRETIGNFHEPIQFGDLIFGPPRIAISEIAYRAARYSYGPIGNPSILGSNPLRIALRNVTDKPLSLRIAATTGSEGGKTWSDWRSVTLSPKDSALVTGEYHIWADGENTLSLAVIDSETGEKLYSATYTVIAPPFVDFDLEPFYTRGKDSGPVKVRLVASADVLQGARLELGLYKEGLSKALLETTLTDLRADSAFVPVFEIGGYKDLPEGVYLIRARLVGGDGQELASFDQRLTKIPPKVPPGFAAIEGPYSYGGYTDHAIQILFPFPARFVFWRSASYVPWWDVDQAAYSYEFMESWGGGCQGCCEPMQDKTCRYSQVELIENSDARVAVHWRYALNDAHYKIYYNEWVDEYYTFYPDGVGVREVILWPKRTYRHEVSEALLVNPPGVRSRQLYEPQFCTLSNLRGETYSNQQLFEDPDLYRRLLTESRDLIFQVHFKDRPKPFLVFSLRPDLLPAVSPNTVTIGSRVIRDYGQRGHWPVNMWHIDGFNLVGLHKPYHGNIGYIQAEVERREEPYRWKFLIGIRANEDAPSAADWARAWLYPPDVRVRMAGVVYRGYDHGERAFRLAMEATSRPASHCAIVLEASDERPAVHPVFIFHGAAGQCARLLVNGTPVSNFRSGITRSGQVLVYVEGTFRKEARLEFQFESGKVAE